MVDSVAALMDGLILWWFFGCDGGSIHCMWLGCLVLFCRREAWWESGRKKTNYGGKVEKKN